jgi:hypothetical protein
VYGRVNYIDGKCDTWFSSVSDKFGLLQVQEALGCNTVIGWMKKPTFTFITDLWKHLK